METRSMLAQSGKWKKDLWPMILTVPSVKTFLIGDGGFI